MATRVSRPRWLEKYKRWQWKVYKDGTPRTFTDPTPGKEGYNRCEKKGKAWRDGSIVNPSIKVSKLFSQWIEELKDAGKSKSHWQQYDYFGRCYIVVRKGNKKVSSLTEQDLQDIILYAFKTPAKGRVLSEKTLKNLRMCIKSFIKYARKCQTTKLAPEDLYIPSGAKESERTSLQPYEIKKLFTSTKTTFRGKEVDDWYIHSYRFATMLGLRPGEICALEWRNIVGRRCTLRKSINALGEITDGKTKHARRSYIMPLSAVAILAEQRAMLKAVGVVSPYVFPRETGEITPQRVRVRRWAKYAAHNGITGKILYEMRHTFFSVTKALPAELIKPIGGHGKSFDGAGTYGHELEGDAILAADMIDQAYSEIIKRG